MQRITRNMLEIYKPLSGLDWMNYKIVRKEDLTFHHIVKRENGGKNRINNGALLMPIPHQYLHLIECIDFTTYETLNNVFAAINRQGHEPTFEERFAIESLLYNFEYRYKDKYTSRGKKLIKYEFMNRDFE